MVLTGATGGIIAGVALDLLGLIDFKALASSGWDGLAAAFTWLGGSAEMSRWGLGLLWLAALVVVGLALAILVSWLRDRGNGPDYSPFSYTHDSFHGLLWRWRWSSDGDIHSIVPFCPSCDLQISPRPEGAYEAVAPMVFRCHDCGVKHHEVPHGTLWSEVEHDIRVRIQRIVRRRADEAASAATNNK